MSRNLNMDLGIDYLRSINARSLKVYLGLHEIAKEHSNFTANMEIISKATGIKSRTTINSALEELTVIGWIETESKRDERGRFAPTTITILPIPPRLSQEGIQFYLNSIVKKKYFYRLGQNYLDKFG